MIDGEFVTRETVHIKRQILSVSYGSYTLSFWDTMCEQALEILTMRSGKRAAARPNSITRNRHPGRSLDKTAVLNDAVLAEARGTAENQGRLAQKLKRGGCPD
jgi:hypothetical protein